MVYRDRKFGWILNVSAPLLLYPRWMALHLSHTFSCIENTRKSIGEKKLKFWKKKISQFWYKKDELTGTHFFWALESAEIIKKSKLRKIVFENFHFFSQFSPCWFQYIFYRRGLRKECRLRIAKRRFRRETAKLQAGWPRSFHFGRCNLPK